MEELKSKIDEISKILKELNTSFSTQSHSKDYAGLSQNILNVLYFIEFASLAKQLETNFKKELGDLDIDGILKYIQSSQDREKISYFIKVIKKENSFIDKNLKEIENLLDTITGESEEDRIRTKENIRNFFKKLFPKKDNFEKE